MSKMKPYEPPKPIGEKPDPKGTEWEAVCIMFTVLFAIPFFFLFLVGLMVEFLSK